MLVESKYSITLGQRLSLRQHQLMLGVVAVFIVVLLTPSFLWAAMMTPLIALVCCYLPFHEDALPCKAVVSESGKWQFIDSSIPNMLADWQITPTSKLLPFALLLVLQQQQSGTRKTLWIWPVQTSDMTYRRLARIIFRQGFI